MATPCIESTGCFILDGLLIQNVANIQSVNAFIGEFDTQKLAVPCFCTVGSKMYNKEYHGYGRLVTMVIGYQRNHTFKISGLLHAVSSRGKTCNQSLRLRLTKLEMLTPYWHLVYPLVSRSPT